MLQRTLSFPRSVRLTNCSFNHQMDKFKASGCVFKTTDFQPFTKRQSGLPDGYFQPTIWQSIKHALGLL